MARIETKGLAHAYVPGEYVLKPMDLAWEDGVSYALLGPSGCGKTTLLNILSGLLVPSDGRIQFDGRDVTALDPRARNIAQVFQFPVVYDGMTVFGNLAYPLKNRGWDKTRIRERVHEIAAALDLTPLLAKRAAGLSPDRKQIISLGRGLVRPDVAAILFDEPLTVIDPHRKWELRCQLRRIYERFRLTLIYVTHDQTEALTFADQVLVMHDGAILQQGSPEELYDRPAHEFVGHFIGSPGMNFLPCTVAEGGATIGGQLVALPVPDPAPAPELTLGIRPGHVDLVPAGTPGAVAVTVTKVRDLGNHAMATLDLGGETLLASLPEDDQPEVGAAHARLDPAHCRLYHQGELLA